MIIVRSAEIQVNAGEEICLTCAVKAEPAARYIVTRNDIEVASGDALDIINFKISVSNKLLLIKIMVRYRESQQIHGQISKLIFDGLLHSVGWQHRVLAWKLILWVIMKIEPANLELKFQ